MRSSRAARTGLLDAVSVRESAGRIRTLRASFDRDPAPALSVVGCADHVALAREIAERSVTLIRDRDGLLPIRPDAVERVVVLSPRPVDLTPADTSSYLLSGLADALREVGLPVEDVAIPLDPTPAAIATLVDDATTGRSIVIVGTIDALAHDGQARLVEALVETGIPLIAVALRTPVDVLAYPVVGTALATYGSQPPNLAAFAAALIGRIPLTGRLPVQLDPDRAGGRR